ncbi:hypothetical protein FB567DRAFT_154804 [Paraphoma chrysanthemicola]|uniref:INO80 complex subunit F domain-containing protein n=1 Tax=Paraphoma chrysanthemicola TaxID=798071 RepID=A0A8K0QXX3_9PLEO|nr:hypothetical protein BKA63DRAFT_456031 [Paraphoma chrysanthemicola]KAH7076153.1 hypothetical protein FB567DRAFT_154804 [Paraphoma chrysanthemicola]
MPSQPARAHSQKDLPPSVEAAYYRKCIDLRRRINNIEESNDSTRQRILRLNRGVQKMRLERAFLLEQLNKHMEYNIDDSDRSSSPPPTPTDKPLRSKRSHNRKGTPPPAAQGGSVAGGGSVVGGVQQSPGSVQQIHGQQPQQQQQASVLQPINPLSSAQSTPDPSRISGTYFNPTSPHAVNGAPVLPPLHSLPSLPPLGQRAQEPARPYFDPAYDEQRPTPAAESEGAGRQRAYSGAQPPVSTAQGEAAAPQNGDTEMTDAGFTSVNR